jgi:aldose 1-epimerase
MISGMLLESSRATAAVDLDGGRLSSLVIDGLEVLVTEGEKPSRWGSFPMIPWCGRLPYGVLEFGNEHFQFPLTSPPHANHGRTHLQAWSPTGPSTIRTELVEPWPYAGHAIQRFELTDHTLTVTAEVHADAVAMPAMIGWHPWFRRKLDRGETAELSFEAASIYAVNRDDIPTGDLLPVPQGPWDACFIGLTSGPEIVWPGGLALTLRSTFDHWVIFTEPEHALCVEPQSGPPNQFHINPQVVQPGTPLQGSMTLSWQ